MIKHFAFLGSLIGVILLVRECHSCNNQLLSFLPFVQMQAEFKPFSCYEIKRFRNTPSQFNKIYPFGSDKRPVIAFCDQDTLGGGWTVIQRRNDSAINRQDFYKNYSQYEEGFGNDEEYWLGLRAIHYLTTFNKSRTSLRIALVPINTEDVAVALYKRFHVDSSSEEYVLTLSDFSGTGGDAMSEHNGQKFSTFDRDQDSSRFHCARVCKAGWWYNDCHMANLNGFHYYDTVPSDTDDGIMWKTWEKYEKHSMAHVQMMVRSTESSIFG